MMTPTTIFDKTAKGREEIATRQHHVATRLRTLLLLVDGKRDVVELMAKVAGLGLDETSLQELVTGEFIQIFDAGSAIADVGQPAVMGTKPAIDPIQETALSESIPSAPLRTEAAAESSIPIAVAADSTPVIAEESVVQVPVSASAPETVTTTSEQGLRQGESQFQAVTNFFNETIRSTIGLRGFAMQLKVERASNMDDLRALRNPYLEAVLKSKGPELERSLRNRLDQLLSL